jgi:jumonji domain-containing protein 7
VVALALHSAVALDDTALWHVSSATMKDQVDKVCLRELLRALSVEASELSGSSVERLDNAADVRRCVATNTPCLLTEEAVQHWPASSRWKDASYLRRVLADTPVSVNVTPSGRGDAVLRSAELGEVFVLPCEEHWSFSAALDHLATPQHGCVAYISAQDDSFQRDFAALSGDVSEHAWATAAFGAPIATNFWLGDSSSETTFHSDPFENVDTVLAGAKHFTLLPPCDSHRLQLRRNLPVARYARSGSGWRVELVENAKTVNWSPVVPHPRDDAQRRAAWPRFFDGPPPLTVTVSAGETLYLPAGWWHYVRQEGRNGEYTCALNSWYDAPMDHRHALLQLVEGLDKLLT